MNVRCYERIIMTNVNCYETKSTCLQFGLLLCHVRHLCLQLLHHMPLQLLRQLRPRQILRHRRAACWSQQSLFLPIHNHTARTHKLTTLVSVLASVEQSTYLMNPALAPVALHPGFLRDFIVLLLVKLRFTEGDFRELDGLVLFQIIITQLAPVVLIISPNIKITIPANAF